jgi:DNA polymerase III epsilon subunit-like protein
VLPTKDNLHLFPYITQFTSVLYHVPTLSVVSVINHYIRIPDNVLIPPIVTEITGIDNELCKSQGVQMADVFRRLYQQFRICDRIVAHNYKFDSTMIQVEMMRNMMLLPLKYRHMFVDADVPFVCTMMQNIRACNIWHTNPYGARFLKMPRLSELYQSVFGYDPAKYGLHNSLVDTMICMRCFVYIEYGIHIAEENFVSLLSC